MFFYSSCFNLFNFYFYFWLFMYLGLERKLPLIFFFFGFVVDTMFWCCLYGGLWGKLGFGLPSAHDRNGRTQKLGFQMK